MDIGKSFGYAFEDKDWLTKLLIGGLLTLIPIAGLAAEGYAVRTLKNVADGAPRPLPEWDDFGDHFIRGLLVAVAGLIYAIPLMLIGATALLVFVLGVNASRNGPGALALCGIGLWSLAAFYGVLYALWFPAAVVNYALSGEFAAFFQFDRIWSFVTRNLGGYIVALLVALATGVVAGLAGGIVFIIGIAFARFWAMLVGAHLLGQLQEEDRRTIAAATAG